ncbi:MAG: LacI family DNA-binding transcriptional regulator [Cellulomonadaceae bacterium]
MEHTSRGPAEPAGRPARPPGITAVAQLAGVSHQTVSRVINDFPGVRPQTRERVLEAITTLGYRRNNAARTLVTQRSGLIGVIAVGSFLFGPTSTLASIEEASRQNGYMTLLSTLRGADEEALRSAVDACLDRAVEAIVIIASRESLVRLSASLRTGVPVIVVGPRPAGADGLRTLSVDQERGGRLAVRHLAELGHREITVLSGPLDWVDAQDRLRGARAECADRGLPVTVVDGDWTATRGHEVGLALLRDALPTAVFAANDHMALGLLSAFNSHGTRVPGDVSVVGFDDVAGSDYFSPALTTIRQDFTTLGHRVLAAVLVLLGGGSPDLTPVAPVLAARASTGAPRS